MPEDNNGNRGILHLFKDKPLSTPPDIDDILDNFDPDVLDQITELSKNSTSFDSYFGDLTDELLRRTQKLPKEERKNYIDEGYDFCSILGGYEDAEYFIRNFFGYLFDRTRGMEDTPKRNLVYFAKAVYDSTVFVLDDKTGEDKDIESLAAIIGPKISLTEHLRFSRDDYDGLKKSLAFRAIEKEVLDDKDFYKTQTVAELIEFIDERQDSV